MNESSESVPAIFNEAVEREDAVQREEFLANACGENAELRRQVDDLLAAHAEMEESCRFLRDAETDGDTGGDDGGGRVGRYKLLQKIGEGGWGIVYMAEQTEPVRRRVALKILKPGMDTRQVMARFEAERQALALMDHPNIAHVLDAGATERGRPYFVMELVRGIRITEYCDQNRLPTTERLELFVQVCQAVQHAHQKGIIHRDIKPSNILVASDGGRPVPKVIDFGVAKATADVQLTDKTLFTRFEMFVGTPAYMSPEQAEFSVRGVDTRTDIYALGVLLYELLTGQTPFDSQTLISSGVDAMRRTIREQDPPKPSTRLRQLASTTVETVAAQRQSEQARLISQVRGDLDWIVLKALEKDRTRRYETANGLAMDVQRFLRHETVSARPHGALYQFRKLVRRNRLAFASAAAVLVALVAGLGVSTVMFFRERDARQRAVHAEHEQGTLRVEADTARQSAQNRAEESRRQLIRLNVINGNRLAEAGGYHPALLWCVEAMRLEGGDAVAVDIHRRRYAALKRFAPQLESLWLLHGLDLRFTADGSKVVGRYVDEGTGFVWDVAGARPLIAGERYHAEWLQGEAGGGRTELPKTARGASLTTIKTSNGDSVFDEFTGKNTGILLQIPAGVPWVQFSQDGTRAAGTDGKSLLCRWQLPEGRPLTSDPGGGGNLRLFTFSADGSRMGAICRGAKNDLIVWDFDTGAVRMDLKAPAGPLMGCHLSPDGKLIAVASWDGYARLYDVATGNTVGDSMRHERGVSWVAFTPDGRHLATASWDTTARLWDTSTGMPASPSLLHAGYIPELRISPDGSRLMTFSQDKIVRLWNISVASGQPRLTIRHGDQIYVAAISADGRLVASSGRDRVLKIWNAADGALLAERPQAADLTRAAFSPDSHLLAAGFADGRVELLEAASGRVLVKTAGHQQRVESVTFSASGKLLASTGQNEGACVWKTADGTLFCPPLRHEGTGLRASFSADERLMVTAGFDKTARVWDVATGAAVIPPLRHNAEVYAASFSPDGSRLITAASDATQEGRSGQIWDVATGSPAGPPLPHLDGVMHAEFSPDGKWAVTSGEDTTAIVWDANTGAALTSPLHHLSYVRRARFSPDSRLLLTVSMDKTARVWDALTGEPVTPPLPHTEDLLDGQWISGGREIFTYCRDGTICIWDVSPAEAPLDELQREAELLASRRLRPGLGLTLLTTAEIWERWESLHTRKR